MKRNPKPKSRNPNQPFGKTQPTSPNTPQPSPTLSPGPLSSWPKPALSSPLGPAEPRNRPAHSPRPSHPALSPASPLRSPARDQAAPPRPALRNSSSPRSPQPRALPAPWARGVGARACSPAADSPGPSVGSVPLACATPGRNPRPQISARFQTRARTPRLAAALQIGARASPSHPIRRHQSRPKP